MTCGEGGISFADPLDGGLSLHHYTFRRPSAAFVFCSPHPDRASSTVCSKQKTRSRTAGAMTRLAERVGFEPTVQCNPYDDLANRSFRPLRHLSEGFLRLTLNEPEVRSPEGQTLDVSD